MTGEHKQPLALATASLHTIIGLWQTSQAAAIRGDQREVERCRREAHDVLDSYFDLGGEAAAHIRALLD